MKRTLPGGIGPLVVGGMEACWMVSALWLLEARAAPGELPAPWLLMGVPLAFAVGRLTSTLARPLRLTAELAGMPVYVLLLVKFSAFPAQALTAPGWLADLAAGLFQGKGGPNPLQISALAAAATWVAGRRLATLQAGFNQILGEFQFGLLILLFVFFCAAQWGSVLPGMAPLVLTFFALFLLGAAAARRSETGGWLKGEARLRWLAALGFNAALVVGVGVLLTAVVTPGLLALIVGFLAALWDTMIEWVVRCIAFLAQLIPRPEIKAYGVGGGAGPAPPNPSSLPDLLSIPDDARRIAAFLVSAFWVVLFAVCLWRIASQIAGWLRRQMHDLEAAQVETLPGSFRQDLLRLLRYVRRRVTGWMAWLRYAVGRNRREDALPAEAAAVRRMYRRLLAWSAAGGCLRRRHQTPHEFLGRLCEWLPEARSHLTLITDHYAAVRYGNRQPGADDIKGLERAWQDVRLMRKGSKPTSERNTIEAGRDS